MAVGRTADALADLERAVGLARQMGDPALFVRAASIRLGVDGTEALAREARASVERIAMALPDEGLRRSFAAAEPIRAVLTI